MNDPTTQYAQDVCDGKIVAGRLVKLACERHLRDLRDGAARGLRFDVAAAERIFKFFGLLHHSKGKWAGSKFELTPWQKFCVGCTFGWKRKDGTRRFRIVHLEVARKNGKSTLAAGIGLALFLIDNEPGAEVYTCATKKDQARITHDESKRMVKASPGLVKTVTCYHSNMSVPAKNAKYEPLAAEGGSLDGLNVSGWIADELHAWKQRLLWDVIETATGARTQPLGFVTTTAGYDKHSIWWERRELAIKVLEGVIEDDSLFALIYTLDEKDDWRDERNWIKANPNLEETVRLDDLRAECKQAEVTPGKENSFKRLRLNIPTEQSSRWLSLELWDLCALEVDPEALHGRTCFNGLDLARVRDMSAFAKLFPPVEEGEKWKVLLRYWVPEDNVHERVHRDRVPYDQWIRQEYVETTPGNTTDFAWIEKAIIDDSRLYDYRETAFDRTFAGELINHLTDEGIEMVEFGQGYLSMAQPTAELERLIASGELAHGGNPVLRWNASNITVSQDPAGNMKPDRQKSQEKIDGIVALIMAIGRAMMTPLELSSGGYESW